MSKGFWKFLIVFLIFTIIILPGTIVKVSVLWKRDIPEVFTPDEGKTIREYTVKVYKTSTKSCEELPLEEYVKGVLAAEMPASFEREALKAQAVCARTYVYKRSRGAGGSGCILHPECDVCDDPAHCQAMITGVQMLKKWGVFSYYHYLSKVNQAVESTAGMVIADRGEIIDPLFFSTSNGKTENSEEVWEKAFPYLRSVTSPGEEVSPRFLSSSQLPVDEVSKSLRSKWGDIEGLDAKDPTRQWRVVEVSTGGRIRTLDIGGKVVKGTEVRELFDLNSTDIKWEKSGNKVKFTCKGFGHGVGMSQYGANAMAKAGSDYIDIIEHYYTGVELKDIHGSAR